MKRILVIDDIESVRKEIKSYINPPVSAQAMVLQLINKKADGAQAPRHLIDEACQGEEGVDKAKSAFDLGSGYDLIVVDLTMPPGINGVETIRRIRQFDMRSQIIVCTGNGNIPEDDIVNANGGVKPMVFFKPEISGLKEEVAKLL